MPEPAGRRTESGNARDRGGVPDATPGPADFADGVEEEGAAREEGLPRRRAHARLRERALERAREHAPGTARETETGPTGRRGRATGA
ncbi:hypothetical protein G3I34_00575, partial [Streptomyces sp. SID8014]|nr:hypothetical protein [Streptomyces sp. SID8014]